VARIVRSLMQRMRAGEAHHVQKRYTKRHSRERRPQGDGLGTSGLSALQRR